MQPTHRYLSNLTPLRGIAAIWVVVFHFQSLVVRFVFPEQTNIVAKGYLMVDLFFIMSGFIICHVYEQSFRAGLKSGNFKRFIVARFARIYPLHFFTLLFLIIYIATTKNWNLINDPKAIPANIFLLHSLGVNKIFTWNVPSWSISAEWWAYMVFPFLVIFIHWKRSFALTVLVLFAVSAYIAILFWIPRHDPFDPTAAMLHNLDTTYDFGFLRGLAGFICGMVLYKIYETGLLNKLFKKDLTAGFLILITVVCMHFSINDGFYIILFVALVLAFALNDGKLHTLCNIRFTQWLGKISYSIYLSSIFLFMLFFFGYIKLPGVKYAEHSASTDFWTGFGYCVVFLIIHIGISSITYYLIEKPFRKYINARWGKELMPVYA